MLNITGIMMYIAAVIVFITAINMPGIFAVLGIIAAIVVAYSGYVFRKRSLCNIVEFVKDEEIETWGWEKGDPNVNDSRSS